MNLAHALRIGGATRLALVGAGGKTTALFQLARQLPPPVIVMASTHLAIEQAALADHHFVIDVEDGWELAQVSLFPGVTLFTRPRGEMDRFEGVSHSLWSHIYNLAETHNLPLLVEADGSRRKPLKAPADHEPVIPPWVDTVVVVAGISGVGLPLEEAVVYRAEIFAELSGLSLGETVSMAALVKVLTHPDGGLKGIQPGVRQVVLLNQADTVERQLQARGMASGLLPTYQAVLMAALAPETGGLGRVNSVHEPVAGVVLAAGGSARFGKPKQVLKWKGKALVRHVAGTALEAGLSPVIVVTGAYREKVMSALDGLPIEFCQNNSWGDGQSTSIQAGVAALPFQTGAAFFLLADQPAVPPTLIRALSAEHTRTLAPVIAPEIDGQRGNPVLFDRRTFRDLMALTGDTGGRAIFSRYRLLRIPWLDGRAGLDIDTPEDYKQLLETE